MVRVAERGSVCAGDDVVRIFSVVRGDIFVDLLLVLLGCTQHILGQLQSG